MLTQSSFSTHRLCFGSAPLAHIAMIRFIPFNASHETKCHTVGNAGGAGLPPPGPLLCPPRGGARSGTRGKSDLKPSQGTPLLGMPCSAPPKGREYDTSTDLPGVDGGGSCAGPLVPPRVVFADGLPGTPPPGPCKTPDSVCAWEIKFPLFWVILPLNLIKNYTSHHISSLTNCYISHMGYMANKYKPSKTLKILLL